MDSEVTTVPGTAAVVGPLAVVPVVFVLGDFGAMIGFVFLER